MEKIERVEGNKPAVWITLAGLPGRPMICESCGEAVAQIHESTVRTVRDLPILDAETWLLVPRRRLACPRCGPRLERLNWLGRYSRVTARLAESVAKLCQVLPVKRVAAFFGLAWTTVKAIDKKYLTQALGPVDLAGLREIAMDEFAIQKGHRYATVVVEPHTKRVLWVGRGRSREAVRPFFELLGPERCTAIAAVAMDKPLVVVLNQVDKIEPFREWDEKARQPGPRQAANIKEKCRVVAGGFGLPLGQVLAVSAAEKYGMVELVDGIIHVLPAEKRVGMLREVQTEYRSEKAKRDAEKGILDVIVEVAGKALSKAAAWVAGKLFRSWW